MRVSVSLLTYNHERYIAQAIESVLAQRGVDFELVVSEDHSTDGTRAIVEEYAARHPDRIRVLPSPHNVGMTRAFVRGIEEARGSYVALLDGDDDWTSPD
jgi:glycosyltransferase involved in cell wall biosynthesis